MKRIISIAVAIVLVFFASAQTKKYDIKSGIVKTSSEIMGQKIEATHYFDNYGVIESTRTRVTSPDGEMDILTITKDGKMNIVNYTTKEVKEVPIPEFINYLNLTPEIIEKYNIKEAGTETVMDKQCTKYTESIEKNGQKIESTVYVWKGYVIKSVSDFAGISMVVEVTDFNEDAFILPENFEIPTF